MTQVDENRFQEFFGDSLYAGLKNDLYNYLLRKRAVNRALEEEETEMVLEVGSGLSPVMDAGNHIVYSDISFLALKRLMRDQGAGRHIVADAMNLPFRNNAFSHVVSSEVLEHLPDDRSAIKEMARVMKPSGRLVMTFPHGKYYFACDDRFVKHYRRYGLNEMMDRLETAGLKPVSVRKVLGPLEKVAMCLAVLCFILLRKWRPDGRGTSRSRAPGSLATALFKWGNRTFAHFVRFDAWLAPRPLSTVLLIKAVRQAGNEGRSLPDGTRD